MNENNAKLTLNGAKFILTLDPHEIDANLTLI